jgi:hypothetical protein
MPELDDLLEEVFEVDELFEEELTELILEKDELFEKELAEV